MRRLFIFIFRLFIFIFICVACIYAVTGYTENSDPRESTELSDAKRSICFFLNEEEFDNIVDKPCIILRGGGYGLVLWAIVYQDGDSLGVCYTPYNKKKKKSRSKNKDSFDTTVFLNKYASIFKWGIDSLPEIISKERMRKKEPILFHNLNLYVLSKDRVSSIPLASDYAYEHKEIEMKAHKLVFLLTGLCWPDDRKTLPIPNDDLGISLPLDKW